MYAESMIDTTTFYLTLPVLLHDLVLFGWTFTFVSFALKDIAFSRSLPGRPCTLRRALAASRGARPWSGVSPVLSCLLFVLMLFVCLPCDCAPLTLWPQKIVEACNSFKVSAAWLIRCDTVYDNILFVLLLLPAAGVATKCVLPIITTICTQCML